MLTGMYCSSKYKLSNTIFSSNNPKVKSLKTVPDTGSGKLDNNLLSSFPFPMSSAFCLSVEVLWLWQLDFNSSTPYLIFVTSENLVMWRNLTIWQMVRWSNFPHDRLSCGKNSPHEKCEENLKCGEIMCTIYGVLSHFTIFCCTIIFFGIYAVLLRNQFWYDLRAFAWRKIELKIVPVEKKWQIWGMLGNSPICPHIHLQLELFLQIVIQTL